jgi:hypothetical protein
MEYERAVGSTSYLVFDLFQIVQITTNPKRKQETDAVESRAYLYICIKTFETNEH